MIFDCAGITLSSLKSKSSVHMATVKRLAELLRTHYPLRCAEVYFVNVPRLFKSVLKLTPRMLGNAVRGTVRVIRSGAHVREALCKIAKDDQLPPAYGGTCSEVFGDAADDRSLTTFLATTMLRSGVKHRHLISTLSTQNKERSRRPSLSAMGEEEAMSSAAAAQAAARGSAGGRRPAAAALRPPLSVSPVDAGPLPPPPRTAASSSPPPRRLSNNPFASPRGSSLESRAPFVGPLPPTSSSLAKRGPGREISGASTTSTNHRASSSSGGPLPASRRASTADASTKRASFMGPLPPASSSPNSKARERVSTLGSTLNLLEACTGAPAAALPRRRSNTFQLLQAEDARYVP